MSFVVVSPELVEAASTQLAGIGRALNAANAAAAAEITRLAAAGQDEVSTAIASVFSGHAEAYQQVRVYAEGFHAQVVQATAEAARQYQAHERHFYAVLAERQAARANLPSHQPPEPHNPAG